MSFRAEFRHPLVGWRNAVEEPALGRSREAGFSTAQNCPRADNLAALEMTEEVYVSLYCAIISRCRTADYQLLIADSPHNRRIHLVLSLDVVPVRVFHSQHKCGKIAFFPEDFV